MSFFNPGPSNISPETFKRVIRPKLYSRGFSSLELNKVDMIFSGDVNESNSSQRGLDSRELEERINWMNANKHEHGIPDEKIKILKSTLEEYVK